MEPELDPARHSDAGAERGTEAPVAGCLECRAVEWRCDPSNQGDTRDISLVVDVDVHPHVAAGTPGSARRVRRLLLFQHGRRFDRYRRRRTDVLRTPGAGLREYE